VLRSWECLGKDVGDVVGKYNLLDLNMLGLHEVLSIFVARYSKAPTAAKHCDLSNSSSSSSAGR
jgi:hypothetical protein